MNPSSNFHTGSVLLLAATVICGAMGITLIGPMLRRDSFAQTIVVPAESPATVEIAAAKKFSEFYPTIEDGRRELQRLEAAAGPLPLAIQEARLAFSADSAVRNSPPQRTQFQPAASPPRREVVQRLPEPAAYRVPSQQYTTSAVSTADVSTADVATVVQGGGFSSPQQLPAGAVYVPVTVNVDTSSLAEQMLQMSTRFEALIEKRDQAAIATVQAAEKKQVARKERHRSRPAFDSESQQQIVRIEAGLQQLAESVNALQSRSQSKMDELELQKSRAEATSELLQTYERSLTARLQSIEASHAELRSPARIAQAPRQTYSDGVPFPHESPAAGASEPVPLPQHHQPISEVQPEAMPETAADVFESEIELKAAEEVIDQPTEITPPPIPETSSSSERLPVPEFDDLSLDPAESNANPDVIIEKNQLDASFEEPMLQSDEDASTSEALPSDLPQTLLAIPVEDLSPIPTSTPPDVEPSAAAPLAVQEVPSLPSVGYEHVYRFKLSDVESDSAPKVVPGDGPVCQHCGLIHVPGQRYSHQHLEIPTAEPTNIRTVSNIAAKQSPSQPNTGSTVTHAHKKTTGDGLKQHVLPSHQLDADPVKSTANGERPSLMRRVGATLKQLTR